jgi:heme exporter protein D
MTGWFSDAATPAWVQAIGSLIAILIAVFVPWRQRKNVLRDAAADRVRQEKEHLQRLTAGLREEIRAASEAADRRKSAITQALKTLEQARSQGMTLKDTGPITPGSLAVTDAIVYRAAAAQIGRLPPQVVRSVVAFYTGAVEINRVADSAPTAIQAFQNVLGMLPGIRTYTALVMWTLDRFEAAGFSTSADIIPTTADVRKFASDAEYPLDEIAKLRGIELPA